MSERYNIQTALDFVDTTHSCSKRKGILRKQLDDALDHLPRIISIIHLKNPNSRVSHGNFFALKSFYIRTQTEKDIEMCCCKFHVHA